MSTSRGRVVVKATCDICGAYRDALPGVFRRIANRLTCSYHPFIPEEKLDATPYITFQARPIKDARPFDPRSTFQLAEEQILALLRQDYSLAQLNVANTSYEASAGTPLSLGSGKIARESAWSAGWAAVYLYELIAENKRPRAMVKAARETLRTVADWLVSHQEAGPGITAGMGRLMNDVIPNSSAQPEWGAYFADQNFILGGVVSNLDGDGSIVTGSAFGFYELMASVAAGIGLLRAYQIFGTQLYADAARACAWFIRNLQCGDLMAATPASSDAAGTTPKHWGAWSDRLIYITGTYRQSHRYFPNSLLAVRFLTLFQEVIGDEVIGSASTATVTDPQTAAAIAFMTASRAALVSACIAEGRAFWETAQPDAVLHTSIKGFSTTTPAEGFSSFPTAKGGGVFTGTGTGSWIWTDLTATGKDISGEQWAVGLHALYAVDGASSFVVDTFDWLMGFTSNPLTELPATTANRMVTGYDDRSLLLGTLGTYDPKFALANSLTVRDAAGGFTVRTNSAVPTAGRTRYELSTAGLLAPMYAARQAAGFRLFKEALDLPRRSSMQSGRTFYLGQLGRCGFSLQPSSSGVTTIAMQPARAAMVGLAYRQAPQAFLGRGNA